MDKKKNFKQFLVVIRGAPASGKTTIAKKFRNFRNKIVWLKVDNFKDFFSGRPSLKEQRFVDESALATLKYLLDNGFSVVMEKIFFDPYIIPLAVKLAQEKNVQVKVFQIKCSLAILQERDRTRPGIKEGCRKPLGDRTIKKIYDQLEKSFYPGAIALNTENISVEKCIEEIKKHLN